MRPEAQGETGKPAQSQSQAKVPSKSKSGSSIGSGSNFGSVFAPRKPNYNPLIGPESKTGMELKTLFLGCKIDFPFMMWYSLFMLAFLRVTFMAISFVPTVLVLTDV